MLKINVDSVESAAKLISLLGTSNQDIQIEVKENTTTANSDVQILKNSKDIIDLICDHIKEISANHEELISNTTVNSIIRYTEHLFNTSDFECELVSSVRERLNLLG